MTSRESVRAVVILVATVALVLFGSHATARRDPPPGSGVGATLWVAAVWLQAELGSADAQYKLAKHYSIGPDMKAAGKRAAKWFLRAAHNGHVEAQFELGHIYAGGQGVPKSDAETARWWEQAAKAGHLEAANYLAGFHSRGEGGRPVNAAEVVRWWRVLHASGKYRHIRYESRLAWAVSRGWGVPRDPAKAAKMFKAQIAYEPLAMCDLGYLYSTGEGVERDSAEAVRLWLRAAERYSWIPLPVCTYGLCAAYATGEGTARDVAKAVQWCERTRNTSIAIQVDDASTIDAAAADPAKATEEIVVAAETRRAKRDAKAMLARLELEPKAQVSR